MSVRLVPIVSGTRRFSDERTYFGAPLCPSPCPPPRTCSSSMTRLSLDTAQAVRLNLRAHVAGYPERSHVRLRSPTQVAHRERPCPRTPGSVSQMSFRPARALLLPTSISRAVITPPRAAVLRRRLAHLPPPRPSLIQFQNSFQTIRRCIQSECEPVPPVAVSLGSSESVRHDSGQNVELSY